MVNQLSTLGRDVRSTPMQWQYEGKKLDATVKHLSWVPPWVKAKSDDVAGGEHWQGALFLRESWRDVPDEVGLGRYPSMWYTLNCKYNAVFDVQRMNTKAAGLEESVLGEPQGPGKQERFLFARDNPDLVMFMLSLRTELQMRIVMPTVLWHSEDWPFMCMARFETGANGNPHWHGFAMGLPGPRFERVRADVDGVGDEAPDTASADVLVLERVLVRDRSDEAIPEEQLFVRVRDVLVSADGPEPVDDKGAPVVESCSSGGVEPDPVGDAEGADVNAMDTRVRAAVRGLVKSGFIDLVEDSGGVRSYVVVPSAASLRSDPVRHVPAPPTKDQRLGDLVLCRVCWQNRQGPICHPGMLCTTGTEVCRRRVC